MQVLVPKGFLSNKIIGIIGLSLLFSVAGFGMENDCHHDCDHHDDDSSSSSSSVECPPPPPPTSTCDSQPAAPCHDPIGLKKPVTDQQTTQQQPCVTTQQTCANTDQRGTTQQGHSGFTAQQQQQFAQGNWQDSHAEWGWGHNIVKDQCTHQNAKVTFWSQQGAGKQASNWWVDKETIPQGQHKSWARSNWQEVYINNGAYDDISQKQASWNKVYVSGTYNNWDLSYATIQNTTFTGHYTDIDFTNALLQNVVFKQTTFQRVHHRHSHFNGATLRNVWIVKSELGGIDFSGAYFDNVNLECSKLTRHNSLKGARVLDTQGKWRRLTSKHLIQLGYDLQQCKSSHINLSQWYNNYQRTHGKH